MLPNHLVEKALHGERIECNDVDKGLHLNPNLLDENVNWVSVQGYFSVGAWPIVSDAMEYLESDPKWHCYICSRDLSLSASVVCEFCLKQNWYHLSCIGLTAAPKKAMWFCYFCYGSRAEANIKVMLMNKRNQCKYFVFYIAIYIIMLLINFRLADAYR